MFKISCLPLQLAALLANCLWKWRCKELCAAAVKTEACWQKGAASIYILSFDKKQVACPGHVLALACRWVQQHRAPKRDYADRRQLAGWQLSWQLARQAESKPRQHFIMSVSKVERRKCTPLAAKPKAKAAMAYIIFNFKWLAQCCQKIQKRNDYNEQGLKG